MFEIISSRISQTLHTYRVYDIKTHDADYVRDNINQFEQQLNVYARIWCELHKQQLEGASVIATDFPDNVKRALENNNEEELVYALRNWDPIVPIEFDLKRVKETIREFGDVVDLIEERRFVPPPLKKLNEPMRGTNEIHFGLHVCRNCDTRYSCASNREFALQNKQAVERPMFSISQMRLVMWTRKPGARAILMQPWEPKIQWKISPLATCKPIRALNEIKLHEHFLLSHFRTGGNQYD